MRDHGPWRIIRTQEAYRDPWMRLTRDEVIRPDGQPGSYVVAYLKPGVCVLPIDEHGFVLLTEEFHYGVARITLEGVSGGIDDGEAPEETARRELREELGVLAETLTSLGTIDPLTSNLVSPTMLFLAERLQMTAPEPEGTERIQMVKIRLADAYRMVEQSEITHAPTCILILKAWLLRGGGFTCS